MNNSVKVNILIDLKASLQLSCKFYLNSALGSTNGNTLLTGGFGKFLSGMNGPGGTPWKSF